MDGQRGLTRKQIEDMLEGRMSREELFKVIVSEKDPERFDVVIGYFQEKVSWKEKILLPLSEVLFVVAKNGRAIVKCRCGYEFEDYRVNWKVLANVFVRETEEQFREIYPPYMHARPGWQELREYYCPGCFTLLEVEAVAPGYPPVFDALPDIQTLYRDWLGRELPVEQHEFRDLTAEWLRQHVPLA